MKDISVASLENIANLLKYDIDHLSFEEKHRIIEKVNNSHIFPPDEPKLYYKHRELVKKYQIKINKDEEKQFIPEEGEVNKIIIKNEGLAASVFFDSCKYPVEFGDIFEVSLAPENCWLTCINL